MLLGSLELQQATLTLERLAAEIDPNKIPWPRLECFGLINRLHPAIGPRASCGRILQHCKQMVTSFRENMGIALTCFKVGVTCNPVPRFLLYRKKNFTNMWVIHSSMCVGETHMLEAALISLFQDACGCQNKPHSGGEGALNREGIAGPFYTYVAGGRADQPRRVG